MMLIAFIESYGKCCPHAIRCSVVATEVLRSIVEAGDRSIMANCWNVLLVFILPFSGISAARLGDSASIAHPVVAVEETPSTTCFAASSTASSAASISGRSRQRSKLVDFSRLSIAGAPKKVRRQGGSCSRRKRRKCWELFVVASVGDALKSALRDVSYHCAAGLALVSKHQGSAVANRLAFGNVLRSTEKTEYAEALQAENDANVEAVMEVINSNDWEHVATKSGVTVVRKFMPATEATADLGRGSTVVDAQKAAKFACVKAVGTLDAEASELYKLFLDNERVHEYNDNCRHVRDLERLSPDTKISWAATPRYGPFKARDFVTVVHYRTLPDGTMVVLNRAVEHPAARRGSKFVRAEILIATNIMRPNRADPSKTDFISVTHINPGGIVDTAIGATIANKLCAKAPVNLLMSLERCAKSPPVPSTAKRPA